MVYTPGSRRVNRLVVLRWFVLITMAGVWGVFANDVGPSAEASRRAGTRSAATDGREVGKCRRARSACLPQVSGALVEDAVVLRLGNLGAHAARFAIEASESSVVDVAGEKVVTVPVDEAYDLVVQGPDRFRFELSGSFAGRAASVDVQVRHGERGACLELRNDGDREIRLDLRSLVGRCREERLHVAAGGAQPLRWPGGRGCYDLEITTPDDPAFRRRITGRTRA